MTGCENGKSVEWTAPVTVDLSAIRCPDIDASVKAEFKRYTPPPKAGKDLELADTKALIDKFRASEFRKNIAGSRAVQDLEKCRGGAIDPKTTTPPKIS